MSSARFEFSSAIGYDGPVRSYGQYCSVAKALDVIGDRWNLLIVRELMLRGPSRYVDLLAGLPGIATNMLVDRLRDLERDGVVDRQEAPPPVATTLFHLTERGEQLKWVMVELARWGSPLMSERHEHEAFRGHWIAVLAQMFPTDLLPSGPPATIELRPGEEPTTIEISGGSVRARPGPAESPDLLLDGPGQLIVGLVTGRLDSGEARERGLQIEGDLGVLLRLRPDTPRGAETGNEAHLHAHATR
jgi:DNA-binding HxlR family transcriptional regulator